MMQGTLDTLKIKWIRNFSIQASSGHRYGTRENQFGANFWNKGKALRHASQNDQNDL